MIINVIAISQQKFVVYLHRKEVMSRENPHVALHLLLTNGDTTNMVLKFGESRLEIGANRTYCPFCPKFCKTSKHYIDLAKRESFLGGDWLGHYRRRLTFPGSTDTSVETRPIIKS